MGLYFKKMFKGVELEVDDLLFLEYFQIPYLEGWVPERAFSAVLHSRPEIRRYLKVCCPEMGAYLDRITTEFPPADSPEELLLFNDTVVWTIADLLVYHRCPEAYDGQTFHDWDFREITDLVPLQGKYIVDAGSGTGRVALEAALTADAVFAVEPVSRLRRFIREKSRLLGLKNIFVMDGFLHHLPCPDSSADIVITSHALGWNLDLELPEFERVVKPGGAIVHCPGTAVGSGDIIHSTLINKPWLYEWSEYVETDGAKRKYWKFLR